MHTGVRIYGVHGHTHACRMTWPLSELSQLLSGAFLLHPSIPPSQHLPTCSPLRSLCVQTYAAGGMLNLFSRCTTRGDTDTHALLQVGLQLKNPLHFFFSCFFFFFPLFLLSFIPFLCLLFEVSPGPHRASSTLCLGEIAYRYPLWLFQMT